MMNIYFFLCAWGCWIWATWMMDKGKQRLTIATISLLAIIFANDQFELFGLVVHTSVIFFLLLSFYLLYKRNTLSQFYLLLISFMTSLGYAALYLFSLYDPMMFVVSVNLAMVGYLVAIFLVTLHSFAERLSSLFLSISLGEIIIGVTLHHLNLFNEIGTDYFLTRLTFAFLSLHVIHLFKHLLAIFEKLIIKIKEERKNVM